MCNHIHFAVLQQLLLHHATISFVPIPYMELQKKSSKRHNIYKVFKAVDVLILLQHTNVG